MLLLCILVAALTTLDASTASGGMGPWMFSPPEPPPLVRLTGVLFPLQEKAEHTGLYTFPIFIGAQERIFRVEEARSLTGSLLGTSLLNDLFPMRLRFVGRTEVLLQVEEMAASGRTVIVTGRLYVANNWLLVDSVETSDRDTDASGSTPPG
jgi:hypothetical protein